MADSDPAPPKPEKGEHRAVIGSHYRTEHENLEWAQMERSDPADPTEPEFSTHPNHDAFLNSAAEGLGIETASEAVQAIRADTSAIRKQIDGNQPTQSEAKSTLASLAQAREYLGDISRRSFDRHVRAHLTSVRIGGRDHFEWKELDRWLDTQKAGPSNEIPGQRTGSSASRTRGAESSDPRAQRYAEKLRASRLVSTTKSRKSGK
jgi:hypothetical protein